VSSQPESAVFASALALDLQAVEEDQRAAIWKRTARSFFPGLSVLALPSVPATGSIRGWPFGRGQLWTILSPPLEVCYAPSTGTRARSALRVEETFSVMLQMQGSTIATQYRKSCRLEPRDICLIDGVAPFSLAVDGAFSQFMFLQMPRHMLLARYPYLARQTAERFDRDEAGVPLLCDLLLSILERTPALEPEQRSATLAGVAQMLAVPKLHADGRTHDASWRARAALTFIDLHLGEPTLTATQVAHAQHISRRRLDDIMRAAVGTPVTAQIWQRRLMQAASDLLDRRNASRTVTEIAFAAGFEAPAHFTRAFKRRYGCTPREWRSRAVEESPGRAALA